MPAYSRTSFTGDGKGGVVHNPGNLYKLGPVMPCEVRLHARFAEALVNAGKDVPPGVHGEILIDTGATHTCVERTVLEALGIAPVAQCEVFTPQGKDEQGLYPCGLAFPGTPLPSRPELFVIGSDLKRQGILALMGRDLLSLGVFVYNGTAGHWTLTF